MRHIGPTRSNRGSVVPGAAEPLGRRGVFNLGDEELSAILIDASLEGICPEFADRRDELVALVPSD